MGKSKVLGYLVAILAGLSFGSIPVISAFLRDAGASSVEQTFLRLLFGGLVGISLIILFYYFNSDEFHNSVSGFLQKTYLLQGCLFSIGIILYLSSIALETPVGEAALLVQIHPFVTLILASLFLGDKITLPKASALILASVGLLLITQPWLWGSFMSSFIGDLLAAANGFIYSIYILAGTWSNKYRKNISPTLSIAWVLFWGLIIGIPFIVIMSLLPLPDFLIAFSISKILIFEILILGMLLALFGSIIPYGLVMLSNTFDVEASRQSILMLGEPIGAIVLGALLLSEKITIWYFFGGLALLTAITLIILSSENV
jgi:drug/metabolite transporter (DMT)-like permease